MERGQGETGAATMAATKQEIGDATASVTLQMCDILLNNFQIKKKRYRVLLNNDHIVWESLDAKRDKCPSSSDNSHAGCATSAAGDGTEKLSKKVAEVECEQLKQRASYGCGVNLVGIPEIVRVSKGSTKAQTLRVDAGTDAHHHQRRPTGSDTPEQYLTIHYAEQVVKSADDCNRWRMRSLTLFNSDSYIVRQWHSALTERLQRVAPKRVRRILVFINPFGGRRQALSCFDRLCKPLFQVANVDASCIISQRANQIRDILMTHDLTPYDAVCCVGGDGTIAEVINGLIFRTMRDLGLDMQRPEYVPKPALPIGVIPAGSTDSIAYSLHGTDDVKTAAIHIILGQRRGVDVCSVRNRDGLVRFQTSVLSYGYLGDLAVESEKYRWMGPKRYEYVGAKSFIRNRGYEVELRILQDDDEEEEGGAASSSSQLQGSAESICYADCARCRSAGLAEQQHRSSSKLGGRDRTDNCDTDDEAQGGDAERRTFARSLGSSSTVDIDAVHRKAAPLAEDDESKWRIIRGNYFMISSANVSCACRRAPRGIAPHCHLSDGRMHVILVRKSSILNNIRFAINSMARNGDIRTLPFVEVIRTRQFSLRTPNSPATDEFSVRGSSQPIAAASSASNEANDELVSSWNCDGEVLMDPDVTTIAHCQLLDVLMRGPHEYNKSLRHNKGCLQKFCCCLN